jgi:hypothetical protein
MKIILVICFKMTKLFKREYVPYNALKEALFYLSVPQIMKMSQSHTYVYNMCEVDDFWLEYLEVKYKTIPFDILKYIINSYTEYNQIALWPLCNANA